MTDVTRGRYRHYKGGEYWVLGVAQHTETAERLVCYTDAAGAWHARPYAVFTAEVTPGVPRFTPVPPTLERRHHFLREGELTGTLDTPLGTRWVASTGDWGLTGEADTTVTTEETWTYELRATPDPDASWQCTPTWYPGYLVLHHRAAVPTAARAIAAQLPGLLGATAPSTVPVSDAELAYWEVLARAATPGPWYATEDEHTWQLHGGPGGVLQLLKAPKHGTPYAEYWPAPADAAWLAGCRALLPRLLAEVRAQRGDG